MTASKGPDLQRGEDREPGHKGKVIKVEKTINDKGKAAGEMDREDLPKGEGTGAAKEGDPKAEDLRAAAQTDGADGDGQAAGETAESAAEDASQEAESAAEAGVSQDGGDPAEESAPGEGKEKEKKGFFHKKEKKDPRDEKIEELTDRLRRSMAEFDNYRKRTDKEKAAMYEVGAKDIIEKILPVLDNFERGLASVPEDAKGSPLAEGMEMIYKQFVKTLEDMGVTPIEAMGQPFDPNFHNAVMHVDDESLGENVVSAELQKGYMYRDSVVRHSMVQVAN